jgi:hypothetical protein
MTAQVPVPLVIVKSAPTFVQAPDELYETGNPEEAVAATVKLEPFIALAGEFVVTVIVWLVIGVRVKVAVTVLALAMLTMHVPVPTHPPVQTVKVEPIAGAGVRVTLVLYP